jgi:hypothetical protein
VQVDPIKPTMKALGTKRLNLKTYKLLSSFAFGFDLRRYTEEGSVAGGDGGGDVIGAGGGRGAGRAVPQQAGGHRLGRPAVHHGQATPTRGQFRDIGGSGVHYKGVRCPLWGRQVHITGGFCA